MPSSRREGEQVRRPVAANQGDRRDQRSEDDEHDADPAVEAPGLGVRPRVERLSDLATAVGVGAVGLRRAGVADLGAGAVADQAPPVVGLDPVQVLALRALPEVEVRPEAEPGGAVAGAAAVRVAGEQVEPDRGGEQERRVARRRAGPRCSSLALVGLHRGDRRRRLGRGAVISVNRISSGSSVVVALDSVADAEVADVEQRHDPAADEEDVARQADPLDQRRWCRWSRNSSERASK